MKTVIQITLLSFVILSCGSPKSIEEPVKKQRPISVDLGKFFTTDGQELLYGGKDSTQHFQVHNLSLKKKQFHYGIGREAFPALLSPEFISLEAADTIWHDSTRFLVAYSGNEVKAYSIKDLTRHEIVNDSLDGRPIMAAYCILADLGAIYERTYGDHVLTFGLSGYTYYDQNVWGGLDGFVWWDRETESLWWPLIGKGISGKLKDVKLIEMNEANWKDLTWGELKESFPKAIVLKSGQDFERPKNWTKINNTKPIVDEFGESSK